MMFLKSLRVVLGMAGMLLWLGIVGCVDPRNQVILVVDTNIPYPTQLDRIAITPQLNGRAKGTSQLIGPETKFPLQLTLATKGDELGPFDVTVIGYKANAEIIQYKTKIRMTKGATRYVPVYLLGSCIGERCPFSANNKPQTCSCLLQGGICVSTSCKEVAETEGVVYPGNDALGRSISDGGVRVQDATNDVSSDARNLFDSGDVWLCDADRSAGMFEDNTGDGFCDDGNPCTLDTDRGQGDCRFEPISDGAVCSGLHPITCTVMTCSMGACR